MKKLPEVNRKQVELYDILYGQVRSRLLLTGIELAVFDHLNEPADAGTVAAAIGGHPGNTGLLLDGLTAIGLVRKKDGLYQNAPLAQTYLVRETETYLGGQMTSTLSDHWFRNDIATLVREGPAPAPELDVVSGEFWQQMAADMANGERGGSAQQAVDIVSALPEFPAFKKMLDLGSGPGLIGIAVVMAHPDLKGVLFDRPPVVEVAATFIEEYGVADRVETLSGDYLADSIGEGYDLVWASSCLNFAKHDIDTLVKKVYESLNPDGVFVSYADGLTDERTKPEMRVLESVTQSLMGQDLYFDQGFIADAMLRAGFRSVRSSTLDSVWGPMDLDIARK